MSDSLAFSSIKIKLIPENQEKQPNLLLTSTFIGAVVQNFKL